MKTPNGNDYEMFDNQIHAAINGVKYEPFDSVEAVDLAFSKIVNLCKECKSSLGITQTCQNAECELFNTSQQRQSELGHYDFKILMTTTAEIPGRKIKKVIRIIVASSSQIAGLNRQATRLYKTAESSLIALENIALAVGANAVVGVTFSANSSQGGSAALFGSSDAVIAMGTAVLLEELDK